MVMGAGITRGAVNVTVVISGLLRGYLQREEMLLKLSTALLYKLQGIKREV